MIENGRTIPRDTLEHLRFASIKLRRGGVSAPQIASAFGVATQTIYNWSNIGKTKGEKALESKITPGAPSALSDEQFDEILYSIQQPAGDFGYPTDLWSGPRLRHFIKKRFGITYHAKSMPRFLRRLGLKLLFPERRALEQDEEAVRLWKEIELPRIEKEAKERRALLFYADETSIAIIPTIGRSWSVPGVRPVVRVSGQRQRRVNVTGAVNRKGHLYFEMLAQNERFNSKMFIRFLKKMRVQFPKRNLTLIVDGASPHKAKIVKEFCAMNKWVRLEYLPAYSPEWNPSEEVWGHLKGCCRNGSQSKDIPSLRRETRSMLRRTQKNKGKVESFFTKLDKLKSTGI
ncbi:MAG: IS630 family transposase [Planctomycetes bacterium]|nr:IS630 family transposase [Planctomycetota bacterium]